MTAGHTVKLIVVHDSEARAREIAAIINKAGYAVKGTVARSLTALNNALIHTEWNLVVVMRAWHDVSIGQVAQTLQRHKTQAALVVADHGMNEQMRLEAMREGAHDAVSLNHAELFGLILRRELSRQTHTNAEIEAAANAPELLAKAEQCSTNEHYWIDRIRNALVDDRFISVFQPIVNLCAEPTETYELLLRMLDESGNEILPSEFLHTAEKIGLMNEIDQWVIQRGIRVLVERMNTGSPVRFFIKLSTASLDDPTFTSRLSAALADKQVPGNRLVFEITEHDAIERAATMREVIAALKQLGCGVALDHVGITSDATDQWAAFEVDYIKIDGRLIHDLATNDASKRTVKQIANVAKTHNCATVAQFVQDAASLAYLWQCDINYIQGYYLQKPSATLNYNFTQEEAPSASPF